MSKFWLSTSANDFLKWKTFLETKIASTEISHSHYLQFLCDPLSRFIMIAYNFVDLSLML